MLHRTEAKYQTWRALAILADGGECLLCVGRSAPHVQASYADAFRGLLDGPEQARVRRICLECWQGVADRGRWVARASLALPADGAPVPAACSWN
jgi:hypothetical protein